MIDKLNFNKVGTDMNIKSPQSSLGDSFLDLGKYLTMKDESEQEKIRQAGRDVYQRSRDVIADARLNKQEARQDKEQAANDLFYTEFAKGQQNKGGLYGDLIAKESDKYAFTDGEIGLATQYKNDPLLARAAGQNALADKIDWQLKAGDTNRVGRFVDSNVDDETRPEMYDRIGSLISSKGYTPPKELIIAADQARLAEQKSIEDKAKLLDDRKAEILKNQTSNLWRVVNSKGNEQTGTDSEGNPIQISTGSKGSGAQNRFNNSFNDDLSKGSNDITEAIAKNTKGATDTSKSLTASDALKFYNKLVKEEGIDPSVAAAQIVNGISSKDPKWYQWLTDKEAKFSKDAIAQLLPTLKETSDIKKRTDIANGTNTGISSKEQAANNLAIALGEKDKLDLAKINADRAKLLLTPDERRIEKANKWLEREGILGKSSSEPGVVGSGGEKISSAIPESLIKAEGSISKPYKDTRGIVTVGVGYAFNKSKDEIERDFNDANISLEKINGIKNMDGKTELTNDEIARLANVSYDRYGVQKLLKIGIDINNINPTLAEIGVSQAYRGDIVKNGDGYKGELYNFLKNDDLEGMKKYINTSKIVPKEVKTRLNLVTNSEGPITREQAMYKGIPVSSSEQKDRFSDNSSTSDISDKYIKSIFEKEKEASKNNFFGDGSAKANTNLIQSGVPQKDIDRVIQEKKDKEKSDNLIADRNYRVALRNNGIYDGKTAEEWNDLRSTTNKIGDYGWAAPVAAALAPATMAAASIPVIANTVNGAINSIKSMGEAKRMQQMLDEAITTTSKAKQSTEDLQKIEQLKEAHKYLLQMMRRGMYY